MDVNWGRDTAFLAPIMEQVEIWLQNLNTEFILMI
jgi:hypothetical protein